MSVNNHRLKPVALPYSGVARPPAAVVSIHQLKLVVLKSELIKFKHVYSRRYNHVAL